MWPTLRSPEADGVTTLGSKQPGDRVNIEVEVLAKYVERLLAGQLHGRAQ